MLAAVTPGCRREPPHDVEVGVRNVGFDYDAGAPVVILESRDNAETILPIWIGPAEAQAIAMEMQHVTPPRPLTHDLMKNLLATAGMELRRIRITDLQGQTFLASLVLVRDGREVEVDSRPSDAIALALRVRCPILVERTLFDRQPSPGAAPHREATLKLWGLSLQDVTPALAETLGLADADGVLVSDVGDAARAPRAARRGDVIVAVDDASIANVAALRAAVAANPAPARVEVRRGGERLTLAFADGRTDADD